MNLITVSTHQLISYENLRINPARKNSTHLIVVFPVALVDVRDDVARGAVLKVTLVCVLVRRVRGTRPVTPHFTVCTANWSVKGGLLQHDYYTHDNTAEKVTPLIR